MGEQVLRFAVTNGVDKRAATWRCWTNGQVSSDFYLACRELGSELKVSFHDTGIWRIAYTQEMWSNPDSFEKKPDDRAFMKCKRPSPFAPGLTMVCKLLTPATSADIPINSPLSNVFQMPIFDVSMSIQIVLLLSPNGSQYSGWPGKKSMNTSLIGSLLLANGEVVWLVYHVIATPPNPGSLTGTSHFLHGKNMDDLKTRHMHAHLFGYNPEGGFQIVDVSVAVK